MTIEITIVACEIFSAYNWSSVWSLFTVLVFLLFPISTSLRWYTIVYVVVPELHEHHIAPTEQKYSM